MYRGMYSVCSRYACLHINHKSKIKKRKQADETQQVKAVFFKQCQGLGTATQSIMLCYDWWFAHLPSPSTFASELPEGGFSEVTLCSQQPDPPEGQGAGQTPQLTLRQKGSAQTFIPLALLEIVYSILILHTPHFFSPMKGACKLQLLTWPVFECHDLCNYHKLEITHVYAFPHVCLLTVCFRLNGFHQTIED